MPPPALLYDKELVISVNISCMCTVGAKQQMDKDDDHHHSVSLHNQQPDRYCWNKNIYKLEPKGKCMYMHFALV